METKFCIECKLNRNVCDFYKNRKKCKTCIAKYKKRYAQENKEKISLQQKNGEKKIKNTLKNIEKKIKIKFKKEIKSIGKKTKKNKKKL